MTLPFAMSGVEHRLVMDRVCEHCMAVAVGTKSCI